jgi:ATP-dependent protease HslVU (ClpYQ) ATPase subunit
LDEVSFKIVEVREKPRKKQRKRSKKYDQIIDAFREGKSRLVRVDDTGKEANYLRLQLKKRIDACELGEQIRVSVVNNAAYLEKN